MYLCKRYKRECETIEFRSCSYDAQSVSQSFYNNICIKTINNMQIKYIFQFPVKIKLHKNASLNVYSYKKTFLFHSPIITL